MANNKCMGKAALKSLTEECQMAKLLRIHDLEVAFGEIFKEKAIVGRDLYGCRSIEDLQDLVNCKASNRQLRLLWTHVEDWKRDGVCYTVVGEEAEPIPDCGKTITTEIKCENQIEVELSQEDQLINQMWDITDNILNCTQSKYGSLRFLENLSTEKVPFYHYANICLAILFYSPNQHEHDGKHVKEELYAVENGVRVTVLEKDNTIASAFYGESFPWLLAQPVTDYFAQFLIGFCYDNQIVEKCYTAFMKMPETSHVAVDDLIYIESYYAAGVEREFLPAVFMMGRGYVKHCHHHPEYFKKGIDLLKHAATGGNTDAALYIGRNYMHGTEGFEKNERLAVVYYTLAADRANVRAQVALAEYYATHDFNQSVYYWLLVAEETLSSAAYFKLGKMFKTPGIHEDYLRAIEYFKVASSLYHPAADYELGEIFFHGGHGIARQYKKAVLYYKIAAERYHHNLSAVIVAECYEHGLGVKKDMEQAKKYRDLAAEFEKE